MKLELINLALAFTEGFALIISPCILPILPIMLSGTIAGGKKRPLGIVVGFVITFAIFTLCARFLVQHLGINLDILRYVALGLIILFGLTMVSDYLSEKFSLLTQRFANIGHRYSVNAKEGFFSGFFLGTLVSLIWVPCAGPILAAVIVQTAIQQATFMSFLTLLLFGLGSAIPMLLIALTGKKLLNNLKFFKKHGLFLRKIFGVIIIIGALIAGFFSATLANLTVNQAAKTINVPANIIADGLTHPYAAPDFADSDTWLNSKPLKIADLKGKVVLIDFWTYSCINCIRTLPYLLAWDKKYNQAGLVIVGVHTPEFEFEKDEKNIKMAVTKFGLHYPIAIDSNYGTWENYTNRYWPAHYLIDKNGNVVYQHFGEGDYNITEHNIQALLGLKTTMLFNKSEKATSYLQTPETYLGYLRANSFASPEKIANDDIGHYTNPKTLPQNKWALQGTWMIDPEKIVANAANAAITLHFNAQHVYAVIGNSTTQPIQIKVLLNGSPISKNAGKDVRNGIITVTANRLYEIADFSKVNNGTITLEATGPGVELYTFTFG